jgi:hypothetical protein
MSTVFFLPAGDRYMTPRDAGGEPGGAAHLCPYVPHLVRPAAARSSERTASGARGDSGGQRPPEGQFLE